MLSRAVLAASLLVVAAACGGDSDTTSTGPEPTAASSSVVTTAAPSVTSAAPTTATPSVTSPPTTVPPSSTAAPTTAAPTTVACRNVPEFPVPFGEPDPEMSVRRGDCGPGVRQIQELLVARGFTIATDGRFGPGTEAAVREFQASVGLTADGIVGPMTWVALNSDDIDPSEA